MMEDAETSLDSLVSGVEPAMVLLASALVGVILLSVMLPLMDIMSTIG
jgi:type IV pilus assembly protein PilC